MRNENTKIAKNIENKNQKGGMVVISKKTFAVACCGLLSGVLGVFFPYFLGLAVDGYFDSALILRYLVLAGVFTLASSLFYYLGGVLCGSVSAGISRAQTMAIGGKLLACKIANIKKYGKGDISQMMTADVQNVSDAITQGLFALFYSVSLIVATFVFMATINVTMALVVGVATPVSIVVTGFIAKKIQKHFTRERQIVAKNYACLYENIFSAGEIRLLGSEDKARAELAKTNGKLEGASNKAHLYSALINPTQRILSNTIYVAVGLAGILLSISIGGITTFLVYTNQFSKPFSDISALFAVFQKAKASKNKTDGFLALEEYGESGVGVLKKVGAPAIEFCDVDFSYDGKRLALENINFQIGATEKLAIVGESGGGKTTIANTANGFFDACGGVVKIFGEDVKNINKQLLWREISSVSQEPFVFEGSTKQNIDPKGEFSDEEIKRVLEVCYLSRFAVDLDSPISKMTEGEAQLCEIARQMLYPKSILILDEATSSLDSVTESKITSAYSKLLEGKAVIIIAHRISTVLDCDKIIAVKNGKIVEAGSPGELLEKKGYFWELSEGVV